MAANSGHRMGGRSARKAKRSAKLPESIKPVRPGHEGGLFKPLKEEDLPKIHNAVLDVLETIGMEKAIKFIGSKLDKGNYASFTLSPPTVTTTPAF